MIDGLSALPYIVVAFTVRGGGPFAKRLGLRRVTLYPRERDNDAGDQRKEHVEAGADHRAHVESAAAAAAFDVRRHAHNEACACNGRIGSAMCYNCGRWGGRAVRRMGTAPTVPYENGGGLISQSRFVGRR